MNPALYDMTVPVTRQMLGGLRQVLLKSEAHAKAVGYDAGILVGARLFPDMFALARQVQVACDSAKLGIARLTASEAPKFDDSETTLGELVARIDKTLAFIDTVKPEKFAGRETASIEVPLRDRKLTFTGLNLVTRWMLPNFYFHVTTAYNLMRHWGVPLGKNDYLGNYQD
ncbi:MAG: DUF1993 domain-containing protein [Burkholderiaceae bacterium]